MTTIHRLGPIRHGIVRLLTLGAVLLAVAGCTTTVSRDAIPPFRQGVATADQQTSATFGEVNDFLRDQQIERAVKQKALTEELFLEALASADLAKWDRAFAVIDSYAEKLERLLDPDQRSGVESELSDLGKKIDALSKDQLPTGMAAAFTKLGGILVKLKVDRDALQAIRTADPAIQEVFSAMMEAIGPDSDSGVRGTVQTSWNQVLSRIDVADFRQASSDSAKRAAVLHYIDALDERDAQDRLLGSLRLSLATLAKTHQELARGRRLSASTLIQLIHDEYDAYRKQLDAIRERRGVGSTSGGTK